MPPETASDAVELSPPPLDGVTRVRFGDDGERVLASSWSGEVSVHDAVTGQLQFSAMEPSKVPVLDAAFLESAATPRLATAGLDGAVRLYLPPKEGTATAMMDGAALRSPESAMIRCLLPLPEHKAMVTGCHGGFIRMWAACPGDNENGKPLHSFRTGGGKVFAMAPGSNPNELLVATSDLRILRLDVRALDRGPEDDRASPLRHQTRSIAYLPGLQSPSFAVGSTEGRVAVEPLAAGGAGRFAFRCHRASNLIFPVNAMAVHPTTGTFATGGSDGTVCVWDAASRKRVTQLGSYDTGVSSLDFHPIDGRMIAIAVSYSFDEGEKDHPPDRVLIRNVTSEEVLPKARITK